MAKFHVALESGDEDTIQADSSYVSSDGHLMFVTRTEIKSGDDTVKSEIVAAYPSFTWIGMAREDAVVEDDSSDSVADEEAMGDYDADNPADVVETS